MIDAGGEGGFLAEVARQVHDLDASIAQAAIQQMGQGIVVRAVVDEHDLEPQAGAVEEWLDRPQEEVDRLLFVEDRYDQRQEWIRWPAGALGGELALERGFGLGRQRKGRIGHEPQSTLFALRRRPRPSR